MDKVIINLKDLFEQVEKIKVPAYQRAYAWEEKQLEQFVSDMLEVANKKGGHYYFGHFILEKTKENEFEIIDGQQRITTFVLFLMVCILFSENEYNNYIEKFETVDYDKEIFKSIQNKLIITDKKRDLEFFILLNEKQTLSIERILFALNYFKDLFIKGKLKNENIKDYIEIFTNAHISTHITTDKAVAVQIFELQNTRGIKLSIIEMVKAILMKAIYLHSKPEETESKINIVRTEFAEIYKLEELIISNTFRGELLLEDILLHHLRIVDDGSKLLNKENDNGSKFNSPAKSGNKEEIILKYIKDRISEKQPDDVVNYIVKLSEKFRMSVKLVSTTLPKYDEANSLIGDVLILDKRISLEFFILLFHLKQCSLIQDKEFVRDWEMFLFTRDFHDKYYRLWYKDNFENLFFQISKSDLEPKHIQDILNTFITNGFRKDEMDEKSLSKTVINFIKANKENILKNAFNWRNEKMVYTLYKYEINLRGDLKKLREIMKEGRSVEHILPQSWELSWIGETDSNNISEKGKKLQKEISGYINGIGNLLLLTKGENSSESNKHPQKKDYESFTGGSYSEHNQNQIKWQDCKEWEKLINSRGELIYNFLEKFIT